MKLLKSMMSLVLILTLCAIILPLGAQAATATYTFTNIAAKLDFDFDGYDVVLTPDNVADNAAWFATQNIDPDSAQTSFAAEGILLMAVNSAQGYRVIISALEDADGQMYFDLNEQDEDMRGDYRRSHTNGTAGYTTLGYTYSSSTWRNYGENVGRFLKLKYSLKQADFECTGYQRRTIRNGYTITVDLQVTGRKLKTADEKYIDRIMSGFAFTTIKGAPLGALMLSVTSTVPRETGDNTLTIKGKTEKGATVTAALISMTSTTTKSFSDTANSKGNYEIKVTFPEGGTYSMIVTSQATDGRNAQQVFSITYERNLLPVTLTSVPPSQISADSFTIAGTTERNAKTQVSVTGPISFQKSKTGSSFSFDIDTSMAGTYQVLILVSKSGLDTRSFSYTVERVMSEDETLARIKKNAQSITYSRLRSDKATYAGTTFGYTGYIIESFAAGSEWTVKMALSRSGSTYKDIVYVICKEDPGYAVGAQVKMYGTLSAESYIEVVEGSGTSEYPRFTAILFEAP